MIKIVVATDKESLSREWHKVDVSHYGRRVEWKEKKFRYKAIENSEILGTIAGKYEAGVLYIASLITKEKARGRGVGTMLVNKAEEFGKKLGAHRIWLITGRKWSENVFYQKLGFELIGTLPDFHFHTDFVIYTRKID